MKKIFIFTVLAMSLVLAACGSSASGFSTGKLTKADTTEYGLAFDKDGPFSVFEGDVTYVKGTYKA